MNPLVNTVKNETLRMDVTVMATSNPASAAQAALADALNYTAGKMNLAGPQAALDRLCTGSAAAHGYFQYALAHRTAEYLAGFDGEVKAVYLYDWEATPEDATFGEVQPVSPLHLIVLVRRKTEALYSLVAAFDRALAENYAREACQPKAAHLLDAQVIDDAEVQRGTGYGALLNSLHHRPLLVWQR